MTLIEPPKVISYTILKYNFFSQSIEINIIENTKNKVVLVVELGGGGLNPNLKGLLFRPLKTTFFKRPGSD